MAPETAQEGFVTLELLAAIFVRPFQAITNFLLAFFQ